jgi:hypothetical protein
MLMCKQIYAITIENQKHAHVSQINYSCKTLHVSDGLSVHHQELKTVHTTTGICQTAASGR